MELSMLQSIISDVLGLEKSSIQEDSAFVDDLGADSLDLCEILIAVEEEYDIEIDKDTAESIVTVADAVRAVQDRTGYRRHRE